MLNKNSKTYQNLMTAFQGESMARSKYLFAAEQAKKEGNYEVAETFENMAINETAHAKLMFQLAVGVWDSYEYLRDAISGEHHECQSMYPEFARIARQEGYADIAAVFERIGEIEEDHEIRFLATVARLHKKDSTLYPYLEEYSQKQKTGKEGYRCKICGAVYSKEPTICVVCNHSDCFEKTVVYEK